MPHRPLRAYVALVAGAALLTGGCTNNEESIQRADEYKAWLARQPQVASVERSVKRNSGVPPLLGSVRLEADAAAKEPFGPDQMAALGDAIEAYGKEHGHFTSYRTRLTTGTATAEPTVVDLTDKTDVNDRTVLGARLMSDSGSTAYRVEWEERRPVTASAAFPDADAALTAYGKIADRVSSEGDPQLRLAFTDDADGGTQHLLLMVAAGRPAPKAAIDGYAAIPAGQRPQRAEISGVDTTTATLNVTDAAQVMPTRTAFLRGSGPDVDLAVRSIDSPGLSVRGTADATRAMAVVEEIGTVAAPTSVRVDARQTVASLEVSLPDRATLDTVVQKVPMDGLAYVVVETDGSGGESIAAPPAQLARTHRLASAALDAGATSFTMRDVRAEVQRPVFRMYVTGDDHVAVLDAIRGVGWEGERTVVLESREGKPSFRFTSTATGKARDVGPASGGSGQRMSDQTRRIIDHWDQGATT